ncbi:MAG: cupredoxin domain-containing protein [Candidatus Kerfeldbacteria bacterium]|nr:cupredoxin domain-containing protein [Candidatus Kerfeldbacteria bacterium]
MKRSFFLLAAVALALVIGANELEHSQEAYAATKTFSMTARQWQFDPSTITVDEGDTVILNITSEDVTHGFFISAFDVSETLTPGQTTTVQFVADEDGTFSFSCNISCGSGHSTMRGTLVVTAADEPEPEPEEDENENENVNDDTEDDTPTDTDAPVLSSVAIGTITETSAVVTWTTDEPAKGRVEFGFKSGTYVSSTAEESTFRTSHGATITNLTAGTTYFYRARSVDEAGNTGVSAEKSFTTVKKETPTNTNTNSSTNTNTNTSTNTNTNTSTNTNSSTNTNTATNANTNTSTGTSTTTNTSTTTTSIEPPVINTIETPSGVFSVPELQTATAGTATSSTTSTSPTGEEESILQGDPLTFRGTTIPLATVTVTVRSDPQTGTTKSDENGDWSYTFEDGFDYGVHTATVAVTKPDTEETTESDPVTFEVIPVARAQINTNVLDRSATESEKDSSNRILIGGVVLAGLLVLLGGLLLWYRKMKQAS